MIEVEAKVKVDDLQPLKRRLNELGAKWISEETQRDLYFNHPQRNFATTDEALRVRWSSTGEKSITYKGPKLPGSIIKTREELILPVGDIGAAVELFHRLGFREAASIVKKRVVWELHNFKVCLDEVEGLGSFVEVEAAERGDTSESEEETIHITHQLGLEGRPLIRESYLELLQKRRKT